MTREESLLEIIRAYRQNPTAGQEMRLAMLISIAGSLAAIADCMTIANDIKDRRCENEQ